MREETGGRQMGQGVCGGVRVRESTTVTQPGKIILAPTKGRKGEERGAEGSLREHQPRTERRCRRWTLGWRINAGGDGRTTARKRERQRRQDVGNIAGTPAFSVVFPAILSSSCRLCLPHFLAVILLSSPTLILQPKVHPLHLRSVRGWCPLRPPSAPFPLSFSP